MKGKKRMKKKEKDYELVSLELNKNYEDISEEEKKQLEKLDTISISFD